MYQAVVTTDPVFSVQRIRLFDFPGLSAFNRFYRTGISRRTARTAWCGAGWASVGPRSTA
jgi:hypothetical protein